MNDEGDFPSRRTDLDAHNNYVRMLLSALSELEEKTNPSLGEVSAHGKSRLAFQALSLAADLTMAVAGWAIDHTSGLAFAGLGYLSQPPVSLRSDPEFEEARAQVDRHEHEKVGAVEENWSVPPDPIVTRRLLTNLLTAYRAGLPGMTHQVVLQGLEALDGGEVTGVFQPLDLRRAKVRHREALIHLRFQTFVKYRHCLEGCTVGDARDYVADIFGSDAETTRGWRKALVRDLGKFAVARAETFAENAASVVREARAHLIEGDAAPDRVRRQIDFQEAQFGRPAITTAAAQYRALKRGDDPLVS